MFFTFTTILYSPAPNITHTHVIRFFNKLCQIPFSNDGTYLEFSWVAILALKFWIHAVHSSSPPRKYLIDLHCQPTKTCKVFHEIIGWIQVVGNDGVPFWIHFFNRFIGGIINLLWMMRISSIKTRFPYRLVGGVHPSKWTMWNAVYSIDLTVRWVRVT
jgi:hypothetical protein